MGRRVYAWFKFQALGMVYIVTERNYVVNALERGYDGNAEKICILFSPRKQ